MSTESKELLQGGARKHELPHPYCSLKLQAVHTHVEDSSRFWLGVEGTGSILKGLADWKTLANDY
jgi:hypothetical protein